MLKMLESVPTNTSSSSSSSSGSEIKSETSGIPIHGDPARNFTSTNTTSSSTVVSPKNESHCAIVLFYYPWCIFSAKAAPHFNAIGRLFPGLHVLALDAYTNNGINMRFGLVGVPSVLFFHNSKLVAKYNDSVITVEGLVSFINRITGMSPEGGKELTEEDMEGPVPTTPVSRADYVLILSWIFVLACCCRFLVLSTAFKRFIEYVRNNWREAEQAQHEHMD